jgi:hypothetical protein
MGKLHQVVAVVESRKQKAQRVMTDAYHKIQAGGTALSGNAGVYIPLKEGGEQLPAEGKRVQVRVKEVVAEVTAELEGLLDLLLTQDVANASAKADIVVDEQKIMTDVPVTHLMFMEKKLEEIGNFVDKLPTLDPAYTWAFQDTVAAYATPPIETVRTKKVPRNHVKAEATDHHPAQVEMYHEDEIVGKWSRVLFNGSIPEEEKKKMFARVRKLQEAVKVARNKANDIEAVNQHQSKKMLDFIFGV